MKLVGGDSGRYEHEEFVDDVLLAPSERVVVDVLFDKPGPVTLEHRTPERTLSARRDHRRARSRRSRRSREQFEVLRTQRGHGGRAGADRPVPGAPRRTRRWPSSPRWTWVPRRAPVVYACPMHPEVVSADEGSCPSAG